MASRARSRLRSSAPRDHEDQGLVQIPGRDAPVREHLLHQGQGGTVPVWGLVHHHGKGDVEAVLVGAAEHGQEDLLLLSAGLDYFLRHIDRCPGRLRRAVAASSKPLFQRADAGLRRMTCRRRLRRGITPLVEEAYVVRRLRPPSLLRRRRSWSAPDPLHLLQK